MNFTIPLTSSCKNLARSNFFSSLRLSRLSKLFYDLCFQEVVLSCIDITANTSSRSETEGLQELATDQSNLEDAQPVHPAPQSETSFDSSSSNGQCERLAGNIHTKIFELQSPESGCSLKTWGQNIETFMRNVHLAIQFELPPVWVTLRSWKSDIFFSDAEAVMERELGRRKIVGAVLRPTIRTRELCPRIGPQTLYRYKDSTGFDRLLRTLWEADVPTWCEIEVQVLVDDVVLQ